MNLAALPRKEGDDRVFLNLFEPKEKAKPANVDTAGMLDEIGAA